MSTPVRTGFDAVNPGMPPALELTDPPNLRHYAPDPAAPTDEELEAIEHAESMSERRAIERWSEMSFEDAMADATGIPAYGPI